ncbi:MAG: hypothetical protein KatS3mg105_4810 [Gemmatales bacterium]|nr:MAG: hypothetical protein KatS3mg105_4810 [Gemmatales bacterium]
MAPETRVTPAKRFQEPVEQPKKSAVEGVKEQSRYLRGTIADELAKDTDHFSEADKQLLKFHGTYQQEDRDARKHRAKQGVGKHYMFMVRCKIPGGRVSAKQYLALDKLAENYANGTLRITSRQGIQFHGVLKGEPEEYDCRHQRYPADNPRGLRRCEPERHGMSRAASPRCRS